MVAILRHQERSWLLLFPIYRFPQGSQGSRPGRNRKPPFGALVTLIINTIVLSIVIIMSTVVVLCIVPRLLPCCSDYYRDSLSVAGVPPDYRDVRGPGDGAGQLVVLLPHPIINNATPCLSEQWFLQTWKPVIIVAAGGLL